MRKTLIRLLLLMISAIAISACGGGGDGGPPKADTTCVVGTGKIGECTLGSATHLTVMRKYS